MFDLSKEWITFKCPKCKYQDDIQLIDIKTEKVIYCPNCKISIQLKDHDASVHGSIDSMNAMMKNLQNLFKNFGK